MVGYPIVGDFDGDGDDDLGTWADDKFSFDLNFDGIADHFINFGFAGVRERPFAADMDQDGIDDIGLWVPDRAGVAPQEAGEWYFLISNDRFPGDGINERIPNTVSTLAHDYEPFPFGRDYYAQLGNQFALPIVGNFDPPATIGTDVVAVIEHTNLLDADDVNNDSSVTPIDALILINRLNDQAFSENPAIKSGKLTGVASANLYVDTNRDKFLSTTDALKVINRLNRAQSEGAPEVVAEAEGESASAALELDTTALQFSTIVEQQPLDSSAVATKVQPLVIDVTLLSRQAQAQDLAITQLSTSGVAPAESAIVIGAAEAHHELFSQLSDDDVADLVNELEVLTENETEQDVDQALEDVLNELFG
jgi:hypothetical protein